MKKTMLFLSLALMSILSVKSQTVYTMENGIFYRVNGVNGIQFNPDGSTVFLGGRILTPATQEELLQLGEFNANNNPPIKIACNATTATVGSGHLYQFHGNKCGHRNVTCNVDGTKTYTCANVNQYLCQAWVGNNDEILYHNSDCD